MRYFATRVPAAIIAFVFGVASANLFAYLGAGSPEERAVLAVEREYVRAHLERDVAALDAVLADDFQMFGGRVNKERRLALLKNPLFSFVSLATEDVRVVVTGDEALVTGTAQLSARARGRDYTTPRYGYTRRLLKRGGRWQIVSCEFSLPSW